MQAVEKKPARKLEWVDTQGVHLHHLFSSAALACGIIEAWHNEYDDHSPPTSLDAWTDHQRAKDEQTLTGSTQVSVIRGPRSKAADLNLL